MSTYDLDALLRLWELEKITEEQAIGQLIVHLRQMNARVTVLERDGSQSAEAEPSIDHLDTQTS